MNKGPVKTKDFVAFLKYKKCVYKRTEASHDHYKCPNCWRTITIREKDKEVPFFHIKTNSTTMGIKVEEVYNWINENR